MEARTLIISEVIQRSSILRIPYFQRRYVWGEKDWERFAIDMESTIDSERSYFLGALIFKEENVSIEEKRKKISKKHIVIDGQQRLTTLSLFMKALHLLTGENHDFLTQYMQSGNNQEPVVVHCIDDARDFRRVLTHEIAEPITGDSNIINAYNFFIDYLIRARVRGVNLLDLLTMVNAAINFVVIFLTREDDEQQIFDTINSLGVPLNTDELLKNFLYEADDEEAYMNNWKMVFDTDEARAFWGTDASATSQAKTKENCLIERFLYAVVRIKMWDFREEMTASQRKMYVKTENVFATFKDFVEKFGMDKQDLANEIIRYAGLFKENLNPNILNERIPRTFGIKRISCYINATKQYTIIPFVLYILAKVNDEAELNNICRYLEIYLVRRLLAFNSSYNKDYIGQFSEYTISQSIDSYDRFKTYIENRDRTQNLRMPSNAELKSNMGEKAIDESTARLCYYLLETMNQPIEDFSGSFNDYIAVQLIPKPNAKYEDVWPAREDPDDEKERTKLIKTFGNYFLLRTDKEPKSCTYDTLEEKIRIFRRYSTSILSSNNILRELTKWDESAINTRNNGFSKKFNETIWSITE